MSLGDVKFPIFTNPNHVIIQSPIDKIKKDKNKSLPVTQAFTAVGL